MDDEGKTYAFLGTFLSIIGFIIVMVSKKDNKYAMYYAKQGLIVFLLGLVVSIIAGILGWEVMFSSIVRLIMRLLWLVVFIAWLISWIYALSGEMKPVPVIGHFADTLLKGI